MLQNVRPPPPSPPPKKKKTKTKTKHIYTLIAEIYDNSGSSNKDSLRLKGENWRGNNLYVLIIISSADAIFFDAKRFIRVLF